MGRGFSEYERAMIRAGLVRACQDCWGRFGYAKTGVRELAAMAGISPGAFYQFYDSKEALFLATATALQEDLVATFHQFLAAQPDKQGLKAGIQAITFRMRTTPWFGAMWADLATITRKLGSDYAEQDFRHDIVRMDQIIGQYRLTSTRDTASATRIMDTLIAAIVRADPSGPDWEEEAGFIMDAVIDRLFV